MTARERKLALGVGVCGLFAVLIGGYLFVLQPLTESGDQATQLLLDVKAKQDELDAIRKNKPRLDATLKRSLPADANAAGAEYEAVIWHLLNEAQVPLANRAVALKSVEYKAPPLNPTEPDAKKQVPAYTAVGLNVQLKRVKYATLLDVLYRYYQLNLLQQITKFRVERRDDSGARRSGAVNADVPDLNVDFTTTALILNGAENRRSLLPVPPAVIAAAGGLGYGGLQQSPQVARELTPLQFAPVLATIGRDYTKLLTQDMFHGPPPIPPTPPVEKVPEKEDTSPFIRLTSLGRNPDGTGSAVIEDVASRNEYAIEITRPNGKLAPVVSKFYYTAKGVKKRLDDPENLLDISESTSGTARMFRVVGLQDGGLVLVSREFAPDGGRKGPARTPPKPPPPAAAAVAGAAGVSAPAEQVYFWKIGDPLSRLKTLSATEGRQAVQAATGEPAETVLTSAVADPDDSGR